jgi:hypothetical protein
MAKFISFNGSLNNIFRVKILDSVSIIGAGKIGLTFESAGLRVSTITNNEAAPIVYTGDTLETVMTLGIFATPTATKCRFKKVDDTNHPGLYEIQIDNARFSVTDAKSLIVTVQVTGGVQVDFEIQFDAPELITADIERTGGLADLTNTALTTLVGGTGAVTDTISVTVDNTPQAGVDVWVTLSTNDVDTGTVVQGPKVTPSSGTVSFDLDEGTYFVHAQRSGDNFSGFPAQFTVTSTGFAYVV